MLGPAYPTAIPELMAYMTLIVPCSQDYAGLDTTLRFVTRQP